MKTKKTYDEAFAELESILHELDKGDPKIEEMGKLAKKASDLLKFCQAKLRDIEKEIEENLETEEG